MKFHTPFEHVPKDLGPYHVNVLVTLDPLDIERLGMLVRGKAHLSKNPKRKTSAQVSEPGTYGTVSEATDTTLKDVGANWTPNEFEDGRVTIISGTGKGQFRGILSNTSNELTLGAPWTINPASDSGYVVSGRREPVGMFEELVKTVQEAGDTGLREDVRGLGQLDRQRVPPGEVCL
jgi:hypothetical protein